MAPPLDGCQVRTRLGLVNIPNLIGAAMIRLGLALAIVLVFGGGPRQAEPANDRLLESLRTVLAAPCWVPKLDSTARSRANRDRFPVVLSKASRGR